MAHGHEGGHETHSHTSSGTEAKFEAKDFLLVPFFVKFCHKLVASVDSLKKVLTDFGNMMTTYFSGALDSLGELARGMFWFGNKGSGGGGGGHAHAK